MLVNVLQWCASIRNFYKSTHPRIKIKYGSHLSFNIRIILSAFFHNLFYQICLVQHVDIELNLGPNKKFKPLTCFHWNVNSLTAHKVLKNLHLRLIIVFTIMISCVSVRLV